MWACIGPRLFQERYSATSPELILIAASTRRMVATSTAPRRFCNLARSTERIWFEDHGGGHGQSGFAAYGEGEPRAERGGVANCELMAATIVMGLCSFETSFWMTTAGRVFWISCPIVGSKATR